MSKETSKADAEFSIVIEGAKETKLAEATAAFSKTFTLDVKVAEQILKSAPIIFLSRLTKQDVRILKGKLMDLSGLGIEFRLTARPQERIPKVNWPIKPSFGTGDGGSLVTSVSFIWDNNAFVCPGCNETFVFRRVGKPKATAGNAGHAVHVVPPPSARPAAPPPVAVRPAAAPARPAAPPPKPAAAAKKVDDFDELGTVDLLDEVPTLDLDDVAPLDSMDVVEEAPPLDEIEEIEEVKPKNAPPPPAAKGRLPMKPVVKPGGVIKPMAKVEELDEIEELDEVEESSEELASVFLNRIPSPKDQEIAAKIIAEVRSCPIKEAKELAARMVIPVLKDIPFTKAEAVLAKFEKAKIPGRITKKK